MSVIALVVVIASAGRLGHARPLSATLVPRQGSIDGPPGGRSVLEHTLARAAAIRRVERVVLVHPADEAVLTGIDMNGQGKAVSAFAHDDAGGDRFTPRRQAARKWALSAWRGGLGGATAWDELLPAGPLAAAMRAHAAETVVLVGGDWCFFDPALADALLEIHLQAPDAMKLAFSQAPPGLGPLVTGRATLEGLAEHHSSFGQALAYNPRRPQLDPIGREVCHPIPATVRDMARRFIYDTPESIARLEAIARHLGDAVDDADAVAITDACRQVETQRPGHVFDALPEQFTLELTPQRSVDGPITPQHHLRFERGPMDLALARRVLEQLAGRAVTLGGLGDAMLHGDFEVIVHAAHDAGVLGLHLETDLLGEPDAIARLAELPIDVISVRLNADTRQTYARMMGADRFDEVMANLQMLFDARSARGAPGDRPGVPWIVPRLSKPVDNLADLEPFFDRWMRAAGHAVIEASPTGGSGSFALMPELGPVPMRPPWRAPSPWQAKRRLTLLSDGTLTLCSQDWLGRAALGHATDASLLDLWCGLDPSALPIHGPDDAPLCRRCADFCLMHQPAASA